MAELDPQLLAELQKDRLILFGAVELILPSKAVRLLDGAAETVIEGETYYGSDPDWGALDFVKGLSDSNGDNAPAPTLGLIPASTLSLSTMVDPALQGSSVRIMLGAMDRASGLPIGAMYVPFVGELNVPTVKWDKNSRRVEFSLSGIGERLFAVEEGRRLSDSFHQAVWPGELGLAFVTDVERTVVWGQAGKGTPDAIRSNYGGYGGFGGGGGGGGGYGGGYGLPQWSRGVVFR